MQNPSREAINTTQVTSVRSAAEPRGLHQYILFLVFHGKSTTFLKQLVKKIPEITEVEHKIGKCIGKSIEKNLLLRNHQTHWNGRSTYISHQCSRSVMEFSSSITHSLVVTKTKTILVELVLRCRPADPNVVYLEF
jgi:hypothetical protein